MRESPPLLSISILLRGFSLWSWVKYVRLVFAGVAYSKLEKHDESEKVYRRAIELFPELPLARQGLQKLYTDRDDWEKLVVMLQEMAVMAVER